MEPSGICPLAAIGDPFSKTTYGGWETFTVHSLLLAIFLAWTLIGHQWSLQPINYRAFSLGVPKRIRPYPKLMRIISSFAGKTLLLPLSRNLCFSFVSLYIYLSFISVSIYVYGRCKLDYIETNEGISTKFSELITYD